MLEQVCQVAREAGNAIMQVYQGEKPIDATHKLDDSPVTAADIAAHQIIIEGLNRLTPSRIVAMSFCEPRGWLAELSS